MKSFTFHKDYFRHAGWLIYLLIPFILIALEHTKVMAMETSGVDKATKVQVQETYGNLPLYFIQNDGQVDKKVKFYEKGSGHATYFTMEGVYITLVRGEKSDDRSKKLEDTSPVIEKDEAPKQFPSQIPSP